MFPRTTKVLKTVDLFSRTPTSIMTNRAATWSGRYGCQGSISRETGKTDFKPDYAMKSSLGIATIRSGELIVSAIVDVNSFGDIFDYKTARQIAGVYDYNKKELLNTYIIDCISGMSVEFVKLPF